MEVLKMTNQEILKLLSECKFEELKTRLITEEACKETGKKGVKNQVAAVRSYLGAKELKRRPALACYTEFNNDIVFTNSYSLYRVKDQDLKNCIKAACDNAEEKDLKYPDVTKLIANILDGDTYVEFKLTDIKYFIAETKANKDTKNALFKFYRIDGNGCKMQTAFHFKELNAFMKIVNPTEETVKFYYNHDQLYRPYAYKSDKLDMIVLPCRLLGNN